MQREINTRSCPSEGFNTELRKENHSENWVPVLTCFCTGLAWQKIPKPSQLSNSRSLGSSTGFGLRWLRVMKQGWHQNSASTPFLWSILLSTSDSFHILSPCWGCHRAFSFLLACRTQQVVSKLKTPKPQVPWAYLATNKLQQARNQWIDTNAQQHPPQTFLQTTGISLWCQNAVLLPMVLTTSSQVRNFVRALSLSSKVIFGSVASTPRCFAWTKKSQAQKLLLAFHYTRYMKERYKSRRSNQRTWPATLGISTLVASVQNLYILDFLQLVGWPYPSFY